MAAEKAAWRRRFRALREETPPEARAEASRGIAGRVLALPEVAAAGVVSLFWPLPGEVDLRAVAVALVARGATVALPAVVGPRALAHRRFESAGALRAGRFGVLEPPPEAPLVGPGAVDVAVVPALALGREGSRLGYGGGYYDAFLAATGALRVGVVPAAALVASVPTAPHDARLDVVVTERETLRLGPGPGLDA